VKNRFQAFAFRCNLHRYVRDRTLTIAKQMLKKEVGAVHKLLNSVETQSA
jgi:hypothetical protein